MPRLFLAVRPPEDVGDELTSLRRKDRAGVRFVPPVNWHVTLRFVGDADIADVIDAIDPVPLPAAIATIGPTVDLFTDRVLAIPVSGLDALAGVVVDATSGIGEPDDRPFRGHLTIARLRRGARLPPALGARIESTFEVAEIELVRSRLGPDGARYETITTWPTTPRRY